MAESNRKKLLQLVMQPGNDQCADCHSTDDVQWASYNIGIFLCANCAAIHRNLGAHISKVKSIKLDNWDDQIVQFMEENGNLKAKLKYQSHVPLCYRQPRSKDALVLREQWIRAKYERQEFIVPERQTYLKGSKVGWLYKRGRDGKRVTADTEFERRKFVLADGTLKYFLKDNTSKAKDTLNVSDINMAFCPEKIGNVNGVELTYFSDKEDVTRCMYLYSESGQDIVDWYMTIRAVKLQALQVAFPDRQPSELVNWIMHDFALEGWLSKTGPRQSDAYKRRWFTLEDRKLMYFENSLDALPKGEVYLGYKDDRYTVREGVPPGLKDQGFSFTLKTPQRQYLLSAETNESRSDWLKALKSVIERPLTPKERSQFR